MYAPHEDENKSEEGHDKEKERDSHELSEAQIKVTTHVASSVSSNISYNTIVTLR
jgi:hypothetical protein